MDNYNTKQCNKCKEIKPVSKKYFHVQKSVKSGFRSICKECIKEKYEKNKPNTHNTKTPMTAYDVMKKMEKRRIKNKSRYDKNKDKINARRRKKYKESKSRGEAKRKKYHENYYRNNKERYKERYQRYKESGKWIEVNRRANQKRRSRLKSLPSSYAKEDWLECLEYFDNRCCYCGNDENHLHQDHFIPLSKGGEYTKNNIVPACKKCNLRKNAQDFFSWYKECDFYSSKKEQKILKFLNYKNNIQQLSIL